MQIFYSFLLNLERPFVEKTLESNQDLILRSPTIQLGLTLVPCIPVGLPRLQKPLIDW